MREKGRIVLGVGRGVGELVFNEWRFSLGKKKVLEDECCKTRTKCGMY